MPELKVPESGGVVRRALDSTASSVQYRSEIERALTPPLPLCTRDSRSPFVSPRKHVLPPRQQSLPSRLLYAG